MPQESTCREPLAELGSDNFVKDGMFEHMRPDLHTGLFFRSQNPEYFEDEASKDIENALVGPADTVTKVSKKRKSDGSFESPGYKSQKTKAGVPDDPELFDVTGIEVSEDGMWPVAVYDTCDTVRERIRAFLSRKGVTQAALVRAFGVTCTMEGETPRNISVGSLRTFLKKSGARSGCQSALFYGAYVFFEARRIKEGRPKSALRLEMEKLWPYGMDCDEDQNGESIPLHKDDMVICDEYGMFQTVRVPPAPEQEEQETDSE